MDFIEKEIKPLKNLVDSGAEFAEAKMELPGYVLTIKLEKKETNKPEGE